MQLDYRANPSLGSTDTESMKVGDYDNPIDSGSLLTQPYPDQGFKSYDVPADAFSYGYLHDPLGDTAVKLNPPADALGWSPDLPATLDWERAGGDGGPP